MSGAAVGGKVGGERNVAIWRSIWLPGSETFIRNQMAALTDWQAFPLGLSREKSSLSDPGDTIVFGTSIYERLLKKLFRRTKRSRRIDRFLKRNQISVIHAHFAPDAMEVLPTARRMGLPLVVTLHGFDVTSLPSAEGDVGERYRHELRALFDYASSIIAVSSFIAERAISLGAPPSKVRVLYVGVPPLPIDAALEQEWDVLFVGRLVAKKGVTDLLRAVSMLPDGQRGLRVGIVGDGVLRGELEATAAALKVTAVFLGSQGPGAVRRLLSLSRIFVAPSQTAGSGDSEGFGMVFLEAALAGVPVLSYDHGGVSEAVAQGVSGLLAPEGDVSTLSDNLHRLLQDCELAKKMGAAGRERALREFDINQQTPMLEAIYDSSSSS